jgi:hypothetical protein
MSIFVRRGAVKSLLRITKSFHPTLSSLRRAGARQSHVLAGKGAAKFYLGSPQCKEQGEFISRDAKTPRSLPECFIFPAVIVESHAVPAERARI